ncbi:MAG TPA: hypothetical protein VLX68_06305 [Chitinivibrionales bacterium]|nr:hypothetical protein [Chitinivibrionales bacterium]
MNNSRKIQYWGGITIFIIVCVALVWNCGDKGTNPQTKLQDLYFTSQISGWVPDSSSHFVQYPPESLFNYIDGPAQVYKDSGLVSWFHEKMNGGPTASPLNGDYAFNGYVHNYGTTAKAKALYDAQVAVNITTKVTLGQYSDNEAQASVVGGGIHVYATFGALYFEFYVMGFTVSQISTIAVPEALKFLDTYKAIVQ